MTNIRLVLCIVLLTAIAAIPCYAQKWDSITSSGTTCTIGKCVYLDLPANTASVSVVVSGTFVATLQFEVSADGGTNWTSASPASTTTAGTFTFSVAAKNKVQVRASAFTSGAATVKIATSTAAIGSSDLPDPGADGACLVSSSSAWVRGECSGTPATDPTPSLTEDPTNVISAKPLKIGAGAYVFKAGTNAAGALFDDGAGNIQPRKVASGDVDTSVSKVIASGTAVLGTTSIAAGACASVVTVSATGVATTDVISWTPNADISGVTGYTPSGTLRIYPYPTANNVSFKVCNGHATDAVTPGAVTLNFKVVR